MNLDGGIIAALHLQCSSQLNFISFSNDPNACNTTTHFQFPEPALTFHETGHSVHVSPI